MKKLLIKEMKLCANPISFVFILFGLMFMIPGYPVLCGAFFVCLGIFQSFQTTRENNDILYTALLPVQKRDAVRSKFAFAVFVEMCSFSVMVICTLLRMTVLRDAAPYRENALMNANLVALGFALVIFGLFNLVFIGGFFKTAYYFGKQFILFIVLNFVVIGMAEALHHFPSMGTVNSFGFENMGLQSVFLIGGTVWYIIFTWISLSVSIKRFEKIDL